MEHMSPKFKMDLISDICNKIWNEFKSYKRALQYVENWHEVYDEFNGYENFAIIYKDNNSTIDLDETLNNIDDETLIKMAIDMGIEVPNFIPSIPFFRNELKSNYKTASQTFEKAFKCVETDPSMAIGLANSALESIIKEIIKDKRINVDYNEKETLSRLVKSIISEFISIDYTFPNEIKTISSSLINIGKSIEDLRSTRTFVHGKTGEDIIIEDPLFTYFIVNSVTTVGLFLINYYRSRYTKDDIQSIDDLPF